MSEKHAVQPILVTDLFPELRRGLISLLSELSDEDWQKPTVCSPWTVKDVAFHMLGGDIGYLSWQRDNNIAFSKIDSWDHIVELINQQNDRWFQTGYRFSPRLLIEFLEFTGEKYIEFISSLDPFELSNPVEWVGPDPIAKWVDIAREYTERWHHQQHIRDAVDKPGFKQPMFLTPVLDAFMMAVPQTVNRVPADTGTIIQVTINGPAGRSWLVEKLENRWELFVGIDPAWTAKVEMPEDIAWRVFTRGIDPEKALLQTVIQGDLLLGKMVLKTVSIIA